MTRESLVFLAGKRTPFGANGGSLRNIKPSELGLAAAKAALAQSGVEPARVDHVIFGSLIPSSTDHIYLPRHIGLKAGIPEETPALGVNRLCGSGFQAIVDAYLQMLAGDTRVALVGGTENMSAAPYLLPSARWGMRMGNAAVVDSLTEAFIDSHVQAPMGITAENLAVKYCITRADADEFALMSQMRAKEAAAAGRFNEEIAPFEIVDKKGNKVPLSKDEHPRPDSTIESLSKLKPVFKKEGIVTAGNASGIVDGGAAMMVSTESEAAIRSWAPLGRLVSYGISGCDPKMMGIGPAPAIRQALDRAGMKLGQMDLIEVNEAFAPQAIAVERELGLNRETFNVNGGAIAIGHPLAASGTRIVMHLLYELRRRKKRFGVGSACIGGGQGIALILEAF